MKTGVLIVTHYGLGSEFLRALRLIIPDPPDFVAISLPPDDSADAMRAKLREAIAVADQGHGVLILTDMFGGTPSNISLSFLEDDCVEVVTGINMAMLVKLGTLRDEHPLGELANLIKEYGQRDISVASELLPGGDEPG